MASRTLFTVVVLILTSSLVKAQNNDNIIVTGDNNGDINIDGNNENLYVGGDVNGGISAGKNIGDINVGGDLVLSCPDGSDCTGPEGPEGPAGPEGPPGEKGTDGERGLDGTDGKDGAKGGRGDRGPKGSKGNTGPQGPQGPKGLDGDNAYGGIAGALALGRIEQPRPNSFVVGIGSGYYRDRTAIAIGIGKAWERISIDVGAFYEDGDGEIGVSGSINWHFQPPPAPVQHPTSGMKEDFQNRRLETIEGECCN